MTFNMAFGIH